MKLWKPTKIPQSVEFCERCGNVCDAGCRADRARSRAVDPALTWRVGA